MNLVELIVVILLIILLCFVTILVVDHYLGITTALSLLA